MKKPESQIPDEQMQAIIERGRAIRRTPDVVRARLLMRAHATVLGLGDPAAPITRQNASPGWRRFRLALAAGIVLALLSAGATAAFHAWSTKAPEVVVAPRISPLETPAARPPTIQLPASVAPRPPATQPTASPRIQRATRAPSPQESYAAELRLLQRARSDYAAHDFSGALGLVMEHARQFPDGRLTEEREALRVRSLAGAGRHGEARLAVAAFARRFPHSVLLSRLQQAASATDDVGP